MCLHVWGKQRPPKIALQLIIRQNALFASAHTHTAGTMDTMYAMDIKGKRLHRNTLKQALLAVTHSDCAAHLRVLLPNLNMSSRSRPLRSLSLSLWAWLDLRPDPIAQMPGEDLDALYANWNRQGEKKRFNLKRYTILRH